MEAFKYCKREHMAAAIEHGAARIGTLFDWRSASALGEMAADEAEGITTSAANLVFYDHRAAFEFHHQDNDHTITVNEDGTRSFKRNAMRSRDVFTFCVSGAYSPEMHARWRDREGYDACFRIRSCRLFFRALTRALRPLQAVEYLGADAARYLRGDELNLVFPRMFHPALLKRAGGYDDQCEIRAIWRPIPRESPIQPIPIMSSEAGRYCDVHKVLQ